MDLSAVRQAQELYRAGGARLLSIGVVEGEKNKPSDELFLRVLTHLCVRRPIADLWVARDVWPLDALKEWTLASGVPVQMCSRYVALTIGHRLDAYVAVSAEEWLVSRLQQQGKAVWVPLRAKVQPPK